MTRWIQLGIPCRVLFALLLEFFAVSALSATAMEQQAMRGLTSLNAIELRGGVQILLPEYPPDAARREAWDALSPAERRSFLLKRWFIIRRSAVSLTTPGIGSGVRWTKNQISRVVRAGRNAATVLFRGRSIAEGAVDRPDMAENAEPSDASSAEAAIEPIQIDWDQTPNSISPDARRVVEATVSGLVDAMWTHAPSIAKLDGVGLTGVAGVIWNTTLGDRGLIRGRSLSIDIGFNLADESGYFRVMIDDQRRLAGGLSFDIGPMADVLVHITDPSVRAGEEIQAAHQKLPIIGCFRYGAQYLGWGAQFGLHVLEMAGAWLMAQGYPTTGGAMITGMRAVGMATVYRTTLERRTLGVWRVPLGVLRRIGLGALVDRAQETQTETPPPPAMRCEGALG